MSLVWSWWNAATDWLMGAAAVLLWKFIGEWLVCWLGKAFCWLMYLVFSWSVPVIVALLELFPAMPTLVLGPIAVGWKILNYFFPLNETLAVCLICIILIGAFRVFRFAKQFIPGMSS